MRAFVKMRQFLTHNATLFQRLDQVEKRQLASELKTNEKFEQIFNALEDKNIKPKQGIFFDGQVFDAYTFVADLIRSAGKSIVLIDDSLIYHFGASLKDLGKKWFAFSKMDIGAVEMLGKLEKLPKVKIDG
jgi:hypothetical protein